MKPIRVLLIEDHFLARVALQSVLAGYAEIEVVRNVHCGLRYLPHPMLHRLAERTPVADLTPRESEVLICIRRGRSNREMTGRHTHDQS